MNHSLLPIFALLSLSACTTVQQPKPLSAKESYAEELLALMPPVVVFSQMSDPYARSGGTPQHQELAHANFMRNVDVEALDTILRNALLSHFSEAELKALVAFCSTPEGRDCMTKVAPFAADVVPAYMREAAKACGKTAIEAGRGRLLP